MNASKPLALLFAATLAAAGCQATATGPVTRSPQPPAATPAPVSTSATDQETFATPEEALQSLDTAVKAGDRGALRKLFGPEIDQIASNDPAQQKVAMQRFAQRMAEKSRVEKQPNGAADIFIGDNDYPFPIPLAQQSDGKWFFDTKAGESEIINRRIGRDELDTIDLCHLFVQAEREYASQDQSGKGVIEYAQRFMSTAGARDGLYWPAQPWEAQSPLGPLAAQAAAEGYPVAKSAAATQAAGPQPFHGYFFKILTRQGPAAPGGAYSYIINGHMVAGFAFVAYPAEYGKSGVMTFIVSRNNVVYQKDLGEGTAAKAKAMRSFNPDSSWTPVKSNDQGTGAMTNAK